MAEADWRQVLHLLLNRRFSMLFPDDSHPKPATIRNLASVTTALGHGHRTEWLLPGTVLEPRRFGTSNVDALPLGAGLQPGMR
jgi:hypothetical protein